MTKQKDSLRRFSRQCLFLRLLDNESTLPWCMESEILDIALVSPAHKITSFAEFNLIVINRSSFKPYGYTGCLKKSI